MPNTKPMTIPDFSPGLFTKDRESRVPSGACVDGSENFWLYRNVLSTAPGHERLTPTIPNEYSYKLDGTTNYWRAYVTGAGGALAAATTDLSIQLVFRLDGLPNDRMYSVASAKNEYLGAMLYKGIGMSAGGTAGLFPVTTAWWISIAADNPAGGGTYAPVVSVAIYDGVNITTRRHTTHVEIGKYYGFTVTYNAAATEWKFYLQELGSVSTVVNWGAFVGGLADLAGSDLFIGTTPVAGSVGSDGPLREEKFNQYYFNGIVQEVRIWNKTLNQTEIDVTYPLTRQLTSSEVSSLTNLTAYYPLTGSATDTYYMPDLKGSSPPLTLMRRNATWIDSGHILGPQTSGTYALRLDGFDQGFSVPSSYIYRKFQTDDTGRYPFSTYFGVSMRVKCEAKSDRQTLFHYVHAPYSDKYMKCLLSETTATGNFSPSSNVSGNVLLEILDTGAGNYQFRAVVFTERSISGETLTFAANQINDPFFASAPIRPSSIRIAVTLAGGTSLVIVDDGAGNLVKLKGTGDVTVAGVVNYTTGAITTPITLSANVASTSANYDTNIATSIVSAIGGGGIVNGTEYTVTLGIDSSDYAAGGAGHGVKLTLNVGSLAQVTGYTTVAGNRVASTPDDPQGHGVKYAMEIGRCINEVRRSLCRVGDPDDIEVLYNHTDVGNRSFVGQIKQLVISNSETPFEFAQMHQVVYMKVINRSDVNDYNIPWSSVYNMEEGSGDILEDIGKLGNPIPLVSDSDHTWGHSQVTTNTKLGYQGVFDHRYRSATGEVKMIVAVSGGACYSLDMSTGATTWFADGFRNDDLENVSTTRFQDSTIMCATGTNHQFQLWKDQLFRLSIKEPTGIIPYGLSSQRDPDAAINRGIRKYILTYWSAKTGKRSAISKVIEIPILLRKANITFGEDAEINQTYPTSEQAANKAPYDCSKSFTKLRMSGWYGKDTTLSASDPTWYETNPTTTGANTNAAPRKRLNLNKSPFIMEKDSAEGDEIAKAVELITKRVFVDFRGSDKIEFKGSFPGSLGRLWLDDDTSDVAVTRIGGIMDFGMKSTGETISGTGVIGHGITFPHSTDPQVTHVEIWRTVANGNEFFLVDRVPNGTRTYVDKTKDQLLVGETLNINRGPAPKATKTIDFAGRYFSFGDPLAPFRLYISEPGEPNNVPPQNTVDLLDGNTLKITGAARTESVLCVFKSDTTFVIRETGNPAFPFQIETRYRDMGCVSPNSIINVWNVFSYPTEQGFFQFDTNTIQNIAEKIEPTFLGIPASSFPNIVGLRDHRHDCAIWFCSSGNTTYNGEIVNDMALVMFEGGGWSKLTGLYVKYANIVQDSDEVDTPIVVDHLGYIYLWGEGYNYGVGSLMSTSQLTNTVSNFVSTTTFSITKATGITDGWKGMPCVVVLASGSRYQRFIVSDDLNTPSKIVLNAAVPGLANGDTVLIGSIEMTWVSGEVSPAGQERTVQVVDAHIQATPVSASYSSSFDLKWIARYGFDSIAAVEQTAASITPTNQLPDMFIPFRAGAYGRRFQYKFQALGPNKPFEVRSIVFMIQVSTGPGTYGG